MMLHDGDIVYCAPIRYFDDPMPPVRKYRVIGDHEKNSFKGLYVYSFEFEHAVYVLDRVFFAPENAMKYAEHQAAIYHLINEDEAEEIVNRLIMET